VRRGGWSVQTPVRSPLRRVEREGEKKVGVLGCWGDIWSWKLGDGGRAVWVGTT
jgi:hypothetical protein